MALALIVENYFHIFADMLPYDQQLLEIRSTNDKNSQRNYGTSYL